MAISIHNVSMIYDDGTTGLSDVNLEIGSGMFALLGPNASGKTTLMRILATLLKPSGGSVAIGKYDLMKHRAAIRSMTGYLPQRFSTFPRATVWEFLDYTARLAGLRKSAARKAAIDELLEYLGLAQVRNHFANELPSAMKRHIEIAQAVIGNPKLLLIDEPTVGLSPEERLRFKNLLAAKLNDIEYIILSTHILSDITSTCAGMAILDKGSVIFNGPPDSLFDIVRQVNPQLGTSVATIDNAKTTESVLALISEFLSVNKSADDSRNV